MTRRASAASTISTAWAFSPATESWRRGQEGVPPPFAAPEPLVSLFDLLPDAMLLVEPRIHERAEAFRVLVDEAWETRRRFGRDGAGEQAEPRRLYLSVDAWHRCPSPRE